MARDIDGLADKEEAGHGADFHGARTQTAGIDTTGRNLRLFEAFRPNRTKFPAMQLALAGFERSAFPAAWSSVLGETIGKSLREHIPKCLAKCSRVPSSLGLEQRSQQHDSWREVENQRLACSPIRRR